MSRCYMITSVSRSSEPFSSGMEQQALPHGTMDVEHMQEDLDDEASLMQGGHKRKWTADDSSSTRRRSRRRHARGDTRGGADRWWVGGCRPPWREPRGPRPRKGRPLPSALPLPMPRTLPPMTVRNLPSSGSGRAKARPLPRTAAGTTSEGSQAYNPEHRARNMREYCNGGTSLSSPIPG